jgi:hypothetical protein
MAQELKTVTVNLKTLDQDIPDPIVASAADAAGRTFSVLFTQEAEAQFSDLTKVYLSWKHERLNIKGYNVFSQVSEDPMIWSIKWPQTMLQEGDVLCCIELVDDVSIVASTNFKVHVLYDPNDGETYVYSDDFSLFQEAVINLTTLSSQMTDQMEQQKKDFELMQTTVDHLETTVESLKEKIDDVAIDAQLYMHEI